MAGYFITGTDTDSGKTLVTATLMESFKKQGFTVNAMKPVAAGMTDKCSFIANEDALLINQHASTEYDYALVNPYVFQPAIAPHIAAEQAGININRDVIFNAFNELNADVDITLVEGAGGWLVPLNDKADIADIPGWLDVPVILVVGLRLGCINHARLTLSVIRSMGYPVSGWVGSQVEKAMDCLDENIQALKNHLDIPCLGTLPYSENPDPGVLSECLDVSQLQLSNNCNE